MAQIDQVLQEKNMMQYDGTNFVTRGTFMWPRTVA